MSTRWPPIIGNARVPWWARLRDLVLTLLAWVTLLYAMSPLWIPLWIDIELLLGFRIAHAASIPASSDSAFQLFASTRTAF